MANPTPGPWKAESREDNGQMGPAQLGVVYGPKGRSDWVCDVGVMHDGNGSGSIANARLIASAPTLLHALKKCMAQLEILLPSSGVTHDERQAIIEGNNAIAEAEGKQ